MDFIISIENFAMYSMDVDFKFQIIDPSHQW